MVTSAIVFGGILVDKDMLRYLSRSRIMEMGDRTNYTRLSTKVNPNPGFKIISCTVSTLEGVEVLCFLPSTNYSLYDFDLRATHARTLLPAALASVSFGFVLVRVQIQMTQMQCFLPLRHLALLGLIQIVADFGGGQNSELLVRADNCYFDVAFVHFALESFSHGKKCSVNSVFDFQILPVTPLQK